MSSKSEGESKDDKKNHDMVNRLSITNHGIFSVKFFKNKCPFQIYFSYFYALCF